MKNYYGFIVTILFLTACGKEQVREIVREQAQQQTSGTIDGGGGNGVNGKPLEAYSVNMLENEDVKNNILPIINAIAQTAPKTAADMFHILIERQWYLIPVKLSELSPLKIGTFFPTDQIALQNKKEVWIDNTFYQKMNNFDKKVIVLHEISMGVRILNFTGVLDNCLANAILLMKEFKSTFNYQAARNKCYNDQKNKLNMPEPLFGSDISISKNDYANIRYLTNWIVSTNGHVKGEELETWLSVNNFRKH